MLLYKLLEVWGWEKLAEHFKDVQKFYRERRDIMLDMIEKHLTGTLQNNSNNFLLVDNWSEFFWRSVNLGRKQVHSFTSYKDEKYIF